jgi:hypothetical protein
MRTGRRQGEHEEVGRNQALPAGRPAEHRHLLVIELRRTVSSPARWGVALCDDALPLKTPVGAWPNIGNVTLGECE